MMKISFLTHKFWMGFNGFVLLFLAVNIGTIGVELDAGFPFIIALAYLVYMFIYLSKNAMWKLIALMSIAGAGLLFYLGGIIFGLTPDNLQALAWTHIVLSALLEGGAIAHLKSKN
jgi:hypothetical protein